MSEPRRESLWKSLIKLHFGLSGQTIGEWTTALAQYSGTSSLVALYVAMWQCREQSSMLAISRGSVGSRHAGSLVAHLLRLQWRPESVLGGRIVFFPLPRDQSAVDMRCSHYDHFGPGEWTRRFGQLYFAMSSGPTPALQFLAERTSTRTRLPVLWEAVASAPLQTPGGEKWETTQGLYGAACAVRLLVEAMAYEELVTDESNDLAVETSEGGDE